MHYGQLHEHGRCMSSLSLYTDAYTVHTHTHARTHARTQHEYHDAMG